MPRPPRKPARERLDVRASEIVRRRLEQLEELICVGRPFTCKDWSAFTLTVLPECYEDPPRPPCRTRAKPGTEAKADVVLGRAYGQTRLWHDADDWAPPRVPEDGVPEYHGTELLRNVFWPAGDPEGLKTHRAELAARQEAERTMAARDRAAAARRAAERERRLALLANYHQRMLRLEAWVNDEEEACGEAEVKDEAEAEREAAGAGVA